MNLYAGDIMKNKKTAAWLAVRALEQIGVRYTFGIPGVHNTELYDELNLSEQITPVLVTSEFNGAFMAEAMSRLSDSIGCLVLVPAAGLTHAASGIGEAFLDGIPLLVITGGVRTDLPYRYQLHDIDQLEVARGFTKGAFRITRHDEVMGTIFEAYRLATSGTPGPVLVEIPVNLQLIAGEAGPLPDFQPAPAPALPAATLIDEAVALIHASQRPALFVGWGARGCGPRLVELAERLQAPVTTTLQGLASFPHDHPLHAGFGFGPAATPAARNAVAEHDCLIAIGARFGEIATGSFGIEAPRNLIHLDINPEVFNANYPARCTLAGDADALVRELLQRLQPRARDLARVEQIRRDKAAYGAAFRAHDSGDRVNPARFFAALQAHTDHDVITTVDDGNHTFLVAELWSVRAGGKLISPTDFNAMGYAVPAAVAAKFAHPAREVIAIVGDGCFRMSGLELATARAHGLGLVCYVFNDGELSQIAQAQQLPYNRKTCTVLPTLELEGLALATGSHYLRLNDNSELDAVIREAREHAGRGQPVIVDVRIDYSRKTAFTEGIVQTNFKRFPLGAKTRLVGRALLRKVTG